MKKTLACFSIAVLLLLVGCGIVPNAALLLLSEYISASSAPVESESAEYEIIEDTASEPFRNASIAPVAEVREAVVPAPITEIIDDDVESPVKIRAVVDIYANFTSTWAKTPTYFFFASSRHVQNGQYEFMLYRLPLNDIGRGQLVDLPGEGIISILGVNEEYLFFSRESGNWGERLYAMYRLSFETLDAEIIGEYESFGIPRFHAASNSILFAHRDFYEGMVWLKSLCINTGTHHAFYEFESDNFLASYGWAQMEDDIVMFINNSWGAGEPDSDFILIDSQLQAERIQHYEFGWPHQESFQPPQNPAEELMLELRVWSYFVTIGDSVYYLLPQDSHHGPRDLFRIRVDGTQNTLLQENTDVRRMFSINDIFFATVATGGEDDVYAVDAVILDEYGNVIKVLGSGGDGHNAMFGFESLTNTNLVLAMQYNFFLIDGWVRGVYNTETGAYFSLHSS